MYLFIILDLYMIIVNSREQINTDIIKWARLESTINNLFNNFGAWEQRNVDLVNRFFNQTYFKWEESLIDKIIGIDPNIDFDWIKDEWINITILLNDNWMWDFKWCLDKLSDEVKKALIKQIHDKVQSKIGTAAPYDHFNDPDQCGIPWNTNVLVYFQKVLDYLNWKENSPHWKKTTEILKDVTITNNDLNLTLPIWEQIPAWIPLNNPTIPLNTKNSFDTLLSFEIGKEADRTISIAESISGKLEWLFTNSFPAINTVVWENDEYKYDESKLWDEYQWELQTISDDTILSEDEKKKKINNLKRKYYIKYLKTKNSKIWDALEQLYNNDFDYSKVELPILQWYLDKVANIRLKTLYTSWIIDTLWLNWWNFDQFAAFYKELVNKSGTEIELRPWIRLAIEKEIIEWKNEWLKDIDEFWANGKSYDVLPIRFKIKKSNIDSLPIDMDDKINLLNFLSKFKNDEENYIIEWDNVWMLIYLFFIINSRTILTKFNLDKQQEIENLFWKAKFHEKQWWENGEDTEWNTEEWNSEEWNWEESAEWDEEYSSQKFKEDIEKLWPWKFENWSEIWVPAWESELPWWWYQWMKIKISNVDMKKWTFTGTVFWWELKFSKYEWKSREFKMDKDTLEQFKQISNKISGSYNNVFLQPNPDNSNFNSFKDGLNGKIWTNILTFPMPWVAWDGDKFIQKIIDENWKEKEVEVKYFWASSDDKSTYKIDYNPIRRSFTVSSSFNGDEKWKDWKIEKKRFSYKRDMDRNNFLIFFTQKWLVPQTEEESKSAIIRQDQEFKMQNGGRWKLNWFSINKIKNVFKTIKWNIKKKMDDYNKSQDEKLQDILIWDWWLYSKLASMLGFIPSMKEGLWELQQEYYNERDNRSRKKIEEYLKIFQSDPDFWTTFDKVPPFAKILWWKSYKDFIVGLFNASRWLWDDNVQKAAALLLANIEKWWSPYRWLSEYENKWLRVKVLLWDDHYQQFLRDKAACKNARDLAETTKNSWLDKKSLNNQLSTCEADYIINNIRWSYWKAAYSFWSKEQRWLNGDTSTEYIDNPSKRLLSDQFANKLESTMKWWYTKASVEETYWKNKNSINSFEKAEDEFSKMWSARYQKGAAALRTMLDYDSDKSLRNRAEKNFLLYLLCWALDIYCDAWIKKQVYWRAKPMSFVPWLLVKERNVAENVAILLDDATDWDFSKSVTKYFHKEDLILNKWTNYKWLKTELDNWLTDAKIKQIHKYFADELPIKDFSGYNEPQKSILEKFKKALLSEDREEADRSILNNPTNANNWLLTNVDVISKMLNFKDWEFDWNDSDDINNKKLFRNDVENAIDLGRVNDPKYVNYVLDRYFSRFWIRSTDDRQNVYKWINTARHYQNEVNTHWWAYSCTHQWKMENWTKFDFPLWTITQTDVDKVLLYALEWKIWSRLGWSILPEELKNAIKTFQKFFTKAFEEKTLYDDTVRKWAFKAWNLWKYDLFLLWWWDAYKKIKNKDIWNSNDVDDSNIDSYNDLKHGQKKEILRRIFNEDNNYINPEMESVYNSLKRKNSLSNEWRLSLNNDDNIRIIDLQRKLAE